MMVVGSMLYLDTCSEKINLNKLCECQGLDSRDSGGFLTEQERGM